MGRGVRASENNWGGDERGRAKVNGGTNESKCGGQAKVNADEEEERTGESKWGGGEDERK